MKTLPYILIAALVIALVVMYVEREPGYIQREYSIKKAHYKRERILIDSIHSIARSNLKLFQEYATKLNKMEGEKNYWKNKCGQ